MHESPTQSILLMAERRNRGFRDILVGIWEEGCEEGLLG